MRSIFYAMYQFLVQWTIFENINKVWFGIHVTNTMEQNSFWEADICLVGQDISCLLWIPKICYRVPKIQALLS
jgi:hypothetical protein